MNPFKHHGQAEDEATQITGFRIGTPDEEDIPRYENPSG